MYFTQNLLENWILGENLVVDKTLRKLGKPATSRDNDICYNQRWSPRGRPWPRGRPRGHILKSLALALASKVKSLALVLASKIALSSARGQHYFLNS